KIDADVTNAAAITPGPGGLVITGKLTEKSSAVLSFSTKNSPLEGADTLRVNGTAILAGAIHLSTPAGYSPRIGDRFELISASAIQGTFTNVTLPTLTNQMAWSVVYQPTSVAAQVGRAANAVAFDFPKVQANG